MRNLPATALAAGLAAALAACAGPTAPAPAAVDPPLGVRVAGPQALANGGAAIIAAGGGGIIGPNGAAFRVLAMADAYVPVAGARVRAVALDGRALAEAVTDERGAATFPRAALPAGEPIAVRTTYVPFGAGQVAYYASALVAADGVAGGQVLDPINTLIEAKLAPLLAAKPAPARAVGMAALKALWADANALDATIPVERLEAAAGVAGLGELYLDLARRHPSLRPGIERLFAALGEPAPF